MKLITASIFPALLLLSPAFGSDASEGGYEERVFAAPIRAMKIKTDGGDIRIHDSGTDSARILFRRVSGGGDIGMSVAGDELSIDSTNPPVGGSFVSYRAYLPRGSFVSVQSGSSTVEVSDMCGLGITSGSLDLKARNVLGPVNLQYSSGTAELSYDSVPGYPVSSIINSASGKATFLLPPESLVSVSAPRPETVVSDFVHTVRAHFSVVFNSSGGLLSLKKR